jgi:hypothetical protein
VNCSCFLSLAAFRTPFRPCDAAAPSCAGTARAFWTFASVRALPSGVPSGSSAAAGDWPVAWFDGFIGTTARSDSSLPCMPDVRLTPSPAGLPLTRAVGNKVSRISCAQRAPNFAACQGSPTTWVRRPARDVAPWQRVAFPFRRQGRRPQFVVFEAPYPARRCPCLRFGSHLTMRPARLGVRMDSLLLSCRTLSFPIACRFISALRLSHQARKALCTRVGQTLSCIKRVGFNAFFFTASHGCGSDWRIAAPIRATTGVPSGPRADSATEPVILELACPPPSGPPSRISTARGSPR